MQTDGKIQYMTNIESYTQRRMLFKDIWETAMHIDEKDDIMNKPKVIKTLRLDEVDKCVVGKTKKQRIKNLRHVCNRILDFCDRQDADDVFYEQLAANGQEPTKGIHKIDIKHPKKKINRTKKKIKKAKSLFNTQKDVRHLKTTVSEWKAATKGKILGIPSPISKKRIPILKSKAKVVKTKPSLAKQAQVLKPLVQAGSDASNGSHPSLTRTKPLKKKCSKKKKPSDFAVHAMSMMKSKAGHVPRATPKSQDQSKPIPLLPKIMIN